MSVPRISGGRGGLASVMALPLLLAGCAGDPALRPHLVTVLARPVDLDRSAPDRHQLGDLRFRGGLVLTSADPRFGGLSSLRWMNGWLHALSDQDGAWYAMRPHEVDGELVGIEAVRATGLRDARGKRLSGKRESDAESIDFVAAPCAQPPCSPRAVRVGFERHDRVLVYHIRDGLPAGRPRRLRGFDGWLSRQPDNLGVESMAGDATETVLVSEGLRTTDGKASALLFRPALGSDTAPAPTPVEFGVPADGEARPSELASLGDGRYIMLRRSWSEAAGFEVRVELLTLGETGPGVTAATTPLARFVPPVITDNYEGAALRTEGDRTFLYLISDDNFDPGQRTLLLKFELVGVDLRVKSRP